MHQEGNPQPWIKQGPECFLRVISCEFVDPVFGELTTIHEITRNTKGGTVVSAVNHAQDARATINIFASYATLPL
jgi:hypothetical protein